MGAQDLFRIAGKVALVTGGSRGLGLQMARGLGEAGCRVALVARKADELKQAKALLEADGIDVLTVAADLQQPDAAARIIDEVEDRLGRTEILVNNAGATWGAPTEDHPDEGWLKVMNLNVNATFFLTREVGRRCMIPARRGKIINIASVAGLRGMRPGMHTIAYHTSKAAVVQLGRALATEWGRYNINVNTICPGYFPSKMTAVTLSKISDDVIAGTPLGRLGGDEDLVGAVIFFSSDASRHVTGQYLAVDGGASAV